MFSYACTFCAQRLLAPPERVGQRTICPKCLRPITIPSPDGPAAAGPDVEHAEPIGFDREAETTPSNHPTPAPVRAKPGSGAVAVVTRRPETGLAVLNPTGMAAVDLAAELSAAISMRMKPPPEPSADLPLTTAAWLALTGVGVATWVAGVVYDVGALPFVVLVGVLQLSFGYLWGAYLAGRRNWAMGLVTLLPPVALWRLVRPFGSIGFKPLWFVLSGLLLVGLALVGKPAHAALVPLLLALQPTKIDVPSAPTMTPADKLRSAVSRKDPETAVGCLRDMARPEAARGATDADKAEVAAELTPLTAADRADVRAEAVRALAVWAPAAARGPVLAALRSPDAVERKAGLELAPAWKDEETARAVAARLGERHEQRLAKEALRAIGPPAEAALLPLLAAAAADENDPVAAFTVLELLSQVGGPKSVDAMRQAAKAAKSEAVRTDAAKAADALDAKLPK